MKFAVFIRDEESTEEFVGLARIDTEADDVHHARERAVSLLSESSGHDFTDEDVALCAELAPEHPEPKTRKTGAVLRAF